MNVKTYFSIEQAQKDYVFHSLYIYPIKCKSCNANIHYSYGLFTCGCRHFVLAFDYGIHMDRTISEVK